MRVGRVRGSTASEARNGVRRMQRALAAREAHVERARVDLLEQIHSLVATMRDVSALAARHAETLEDLVLHQGGRFDVLARVHGLLLRDSGSVDLETMVWDELSGAISPSEGDRMVISGPSVLLDPLTSELLALGLHELAMNAIKFGALADDVGRVEVTWSVAAGPERKLRLNWVESEVSPPAQLPTHRGFGRELLETVLPRRLGASTRFEFTASGVCCEIQVPLGEMRLERNPELAVAA